MRRAAPRALERTAAVLGPALASAVDRLSPDLAGPARFHFGWTGAPGVPPSPGQAGKGVRPALAFLSAEAVGAAAEIALPGAVAVELIHNFSLIHDDIIDADTDRRHRPTVWKVFGVGDAIIVGDALVALAFESLLAERTAARTAAAADLARATGSMISGQYMDMVSANRGGGIERCWEMVSRKTGALIAHASAVGAILSEAPPATVACLRRFGEELGRAFQAIDDLLGIWGDPSITGKPAGNDLRERKRSIPVALALGSDSELARELADLYAQDQLDDAGIARAADLVEEAGGRAGALAASRECLARAADALAATDLAPRPVQELLDLARFVVDRDF